MSAWSLAKPCGVTKTSPSPSFSSKRVIAQYIYIYKENITSLLRNLNGRK